MAIHQRRPQRKVLRHTHHCVVNSGVAVGVVLSHRFPHNGRAFAMASVGVEIQIGEHRIQDAALHWLQSVSDIGQRTAGNHRKGVVEIPLAGGFMQGDGFGLGHKRRNRFSYNGGNECTSLSTNGDAGSCMKQRTCSMKRD